MHGAVVPKGSGLCWDSETGQRNSPREHQPCLFPSGTSSSEDKPTYDVYSYLSEKERGKVKAYLSSSKPLAAPQHAHLWLLLPGFQPRSPVPLNPLPVSQVMCHFNTGHILVSGMVSELKLKPQTFFIRNSLQTCSWMFGSQMNGSHSPGHLATSPSQRGNKNHHFYWLCADHEPPMIPARSLLLTTIRSIYHPHFQGEGPARSQWDLCWGLSCNCCA